MSRKSKTRIRTHPGAILLHEFMEPLELSARALGALLGVPPNRLTEIIKGRRGITADTALRLSRYFGTTPEFWMNLQAAHDLTQALSQHKYDEIPSRSAA
jgi:addiction module HigA family antidote